MSAPNAGPNVPVEQPNPALGLLEGLTPEQAQAVRHGPGPLLLLAGPGAGKTRTLTHRIAYLLASGYAKPWEILAVTFSVRAAGELRLRLADLLGQERARAVTAVTFHSVCARMLREHAAVFGRTESYTVYDQADMRKVIEWLLSDAQRHTIASALTCCGQPASAEVLHELSLAKNRLLSPDSYEHANQHPAAALIAAVWREADLELCHSNAFDFDDLLLYAVRLLGEHPHRLAHYRGRWRWLLVDEMQDTNEAQCALVSLLAGPDGNVTCCGDDDQVLYTWRGAEARHVLDFAQRFPGHHQIVLARNFRSRAEILQAAVSCVAHNERRCEKALVAVRGPGGRVQVLAFASEHHEAHWVTAAIAGALTDGVAPSEVLVLARTGYASLTLQSTLAAAGIAHRVLGSLGLYERAEVRDALAYLALLANPADAQAFRRAVQAPKRGVGAATAGRVIALARERDRGDLIAACTRAGELEQIRSPAVRQRLTRFGSALAQIRSELAAGRSVGHVVLAAVTLEDGLVRCFEARRDGSPKAEQRRDAARVLEDLRSLCRAAQAYDEQQPDRATLSGFLEATAGLHAQELSPEQDHRITLSTIHRAKGTEAQLVVLLACEEQLLPSWRSLASPDHEQLAEERRLFYVAATRAKDRLILTHTARRAGRLTAGPSRFLTEAGLSTHPQALAA